MVSSAEVSSKRFSVTRFREGYDRGDVEKFLAKAAAALAPGSPAGSLTTKDVRDARFRPTRFHEGFDQDEVDDFLDRISAALEKAAPPA
ncbi:DivIVA domain-containing protein [Herbiconiux liukaitaii]|uniref:DivIVA domain-containing protein n=1 Tax=Herbiconiux liukaitaii TaxID=3342799 RepID=UPI0035BB0472